MYELSSPPSSYCSKRRGVVRLFPGAEAVLRRLATDTAFEKVQIAVASSTTDAQILPILCIRYPFSKSLHSQRNALRVFPYLAASL
ncbi:Magnesium-dependent phosphatase 1 [Durusdinium trenchii]|uniref:Magnesium-dependent phosphatase 1 n=1 Tax=Durusdinium trenchii TaxID=1381693 RepID=A0ABP0N8R0_9DINO